LNTNRCLGYARKPFKLFCMSNTKYVLYSYFLFLILFTLPQFSVHAQEKSKKKRERPEKEFSGDEDYYNKNFLRYDNYVYNPMVKTVTFHQLKDELSPPILNINSDDVLKLGFDVMDQNLKNYMFTFIHCDPNWNPSPLHSAEYLDGFFDNYITDYRFSINTLQKYIHYNITFPNDNVKFTQSGNYLLLVYEENNRDKPILTRRFMVYQERVRVSPRINRPAAAEDRMFKQKVDFSVHHMGYKILNPQSDVKVAILQNNRWDNAITGLKPLFIKDNELTYDYDTENTFFGGNEFRNFDIKTIRFRTQFVETVDYADGMNIIKLKENNVRGSSRYSTEPDINGKFVVRFQEGWDSDVEADYSLVEFRLKYPAPITDGNVYVFGALTDWAHPEEAKMTYDYETKSYKATLMLKQGYYNFKYVTLKDNEKGGSSLLLEGSYFETENDYTILVYHKEPATHFFKLVGIKQVNSRSTF
jgi:hypothetical protein